jgi:hypothetical protein
MSKAKTTFEVQEYATAELGASAGGKQLWLFRLPKGATSPDQPRHQSIISR